MEGSTVTAPETPGIVFGITVTKIESVATVGAVPEMVTYAKSVDESVLVVVTVPFVTVTVGADVKA